MPTGGLPAKFSSETSRGEFIQLRELTETGSQAARQPDGRAQVSIGRPAPPKIHGKTLIFQLILSNFHPVIYYAH